MRVIMFILVFTVLAVPLHLLSQGPGDNSQSKSLAPFIDNTTFIVARFDLSRPDSDELAFIMPSIERFLNMNSDLYSVQIKELFGSLRKTGAKEFYAVYGFPGTLPVYVTPLADGVNEKSILDLFGPQSVFRNIKAEKSGAAMVIGNVEVLDNYRKRAPAPRPEFSKAFDVFSGMTCQVAVALSPEVRRTFEEMIPMLPKELGGGSTTVLTRDLKWAALSLNAAPKNLILLNLVAQAADEAAAGRLEGWIPSFLKSFQTRALKEGPQTQEFKDMWSKLGSAIPEHSRSGDKVILQLNAATSAVVLQPFIAWSQFDSEVKISAMKLRGIASAMHRYSDVNKTFPAPASYDQQGTSLLSWRVHLLPYMGLQALYKQFKLDEPWDSAQNKKLIAQMPAVYGHSAGKGVTEGKTPFLVPVGRETIFPGQKGIQPQEVTMADGLANTVLLFEVADDNMVIWTKPDDWQFDPKDPRRGLVDKTRPAFLAALADAAVYLIKNEVSADTLRLIITRNGGEWQRDDWNEMARVIW